MTSTPLRLVFCLLLIGVASGCRSANETDSPRLSIAVAPALEPLAAKLTEEFNRINPQGIPLQIDVVPDSKIQADGEENSADTTLDWREPQDGMWSVRLGWTGIVFMVHPDLPMEDLSGADARKIYLGSIRQWEEVGTAAGEIHGLAYASDLGFEELFDGSVLGTNRLTTNATLVPSVDAMLAAILADPQSIGYIMGFSIKPSVHILTIDGVTADYQNFLSGRYPFRVPLYLQAKDPVPNEIQNFAGWVQSVAGQTILMEIHTRE